MDWAMEIADWKGFEQRRREAAKRGKLLGLGLANYVESSIGAPNEQARITVRPEGRVDVVIGTQPSGQGHETSFAQVVSDLLHVPVETREDHPRRHRRREGRRRLAFRPLDAPRRDRVLEGRRRPDRARASRSPPSILGIDAGPDRVQRRPLQRARHQPHLRFPRARRRRRRATSCPTISRTASRSSPTTRCTIRCFPTAAPSARSRSIPTPATSRITRYASVDDVGRCINPLIVHGQTHGAHRAGRRPGDVGAVLRRSRLRPAADRLAHGLRHAARRHAAVVQDRDRRGALADQSARHQGRRRRRHHGGAGGRRQRHRRRAARLRRARHQDAGDAVQDLEDDPGRQDAKDEKARGQARRINSGRK